MKPITLGSITRMISQAVAKQTKPYLRPAKIIGKSATKSGYTIIEYRNGAQAEVWNPSLPNTAGFEVYVGRNPFVGNRLQILGLRDVKYATDFETPPVVAEHHETHEYPNGDWVRVRGDQFLPLLALPKSGFIISVAGWAVHFSGAWADIANQDLDLTSHKPTDGARWVLLEATPSGTLNLVDSSVVGSKELLTLSNLPVPTSGNYPLCGIKLYTGQVKIQRDIRPGKTSDFKDLRFTGYAVGGGAGYDLAAGIHGATASAITNSDEIAFWEDTSNALRKITWSNIISTLKTYFDTVYAIIGSGGGGAFQRNLTADLTLTDGQSLVVTGYIDPGASYSVNFEGDADLEIL